MDVLTIKRTETDKTDNNTIFFFQAIYRRHHINETVRQDLYRLTVSGKLSYRNGNESKICFVKGFKGINLTFS